jgi:hypothetical protein
MVLLILDQLIETIQGTDTVPRLKEVWSRVLPVLASIKHDNMRWVFAASIGHFCDSILQYEANTRNKENHIPAVHFASDVFPCYEMMYANWLMSKEAKVVKAIVRLS